MASRAAGVNSAPRALKGIPRRGHKAPILARMTPLRPHARRAALRRRGLQWITPLRSRSQRARARRPGRADRRGRVARSRRRGGGFAQPGAPLDFGKFRHWRPAGDGRGRRLPIVATFDAEASLRSRPMRRVLDPLALMGARPVRVSDGGRLPLALQGARDPMPRLPPTPVFFHPPRKRSHRVRLLRPWTTGQGQLGGWRRFPRPQCSVRANCQNAGT